MVFCDYNVMLFFVFFVFWNLLMLKKRYVIDIIGVYIEILEMLFVIFVGF